jgi:hypothetical protein
VRDRGDLKPRPDYVSPFALLEIGEHMRKGAVKYQPRNWELGQPFSEMTASMYRHLLQWTMGDDAENHLAAIVFNAQALMHYREMIKRGVLPAELDDMPKYEPKTPVEVASEPACGFACDECATYENCVFRESDAELAS